MKTSRRLLGQVRRTMLVTTVLATASAASMAVLPLGALILVDAALPQGSVDLVLVLAAGTAAAIAVAAVLDLTRELLFARAAYRVDHVMGQRIIDAAARSACSGTEFVARAEAVGTVRDAFAHGRIIVLAELPAVALAIGALVYIDPRLGATGAASAAALLSLTLLLRLASRKPGNASRKHRHEARSFLSTLAPQRLDDDPAIAEAAAAHWEKLNRGHVALGYKSTLRLGAGRALARPLAVTGIAAVLIHGTVLAIGGAISGGAAVAAALVMFRALGTLEQYALHAGDIDTFRQALKVLAAAEEAALRAPKKMRPQAVGPDRAALPQRYAA